ncbi:MAG TPA: T9SS type A sorting domain-containing protein [bacterium]|nr:T9SS type A sorting domain-containing protein [bacterium]
MIRVLKVAGLFTLLMGLRVVRAERPVFQYRSGHFSRRMTRTAPLEKGRHPWMFERSFHADKNDSIHVVALRAEFQPDENPLTTGSGLFDLSEPAEQRVDPPPHDRAYFEAQMRALAHYYRTVSRHRLTVTFSVPDPVLRLPDEMGGYNPATDPQSTERGLVRLFRDAVKAADSLGIGITSGDAVIVFHAGVGKDLDLGYDPTPRDIPSAFLDLEDLRSHLAEGDPGYAGIPVQGGSHRVREGIIVPETQSQEGYEIGLLGTLTLMFGFQLGLPALWDTDTGTSGIGRWGLMDQGSNNYFGLIPAWPCAWTRLYMGWDEAAETVWGVDLAVACSMAESAQRIIRVPINDHEYFLVENRQYDVNGDGITRGWDAAGVEVTFHPDGRLVSSVPFGVITRVEEYDYGLPGSGILIWHIDEDVISRKLPENRINSDREHRGVDLEEADGAKDIGYRYGLTDPGAGAELGVLHDAWFASNEVHKRVNRSDSVAFTPATYPRTASNSGADSHLHLTRFSERDTIMSFQVRNEWIRSGFPRDFGLGHVPFSPLMADINGSGIREVVVVTRGGMIFAWDESGHPLVNNGALGRTVNVAGDTVDIPAALLAVTGSSVVTEPAAADLNGDGFDEIVTATADGQLTGWTARDEDGDGFGDRVFQWQSSQDSITALLLYPAAGGYYPVLGTASGELIFLDPAAGIPLWTQNLGAAVSGLCMGVSGGLRILWAGTSAGSLFCYNGITGERLWNESVGSRPLWPPAAGLWPETGAGVAVCYEGGGAVFDIQGNRIGTLTHSVIPAGRPALGDVDGDGVPEVVLPGRDRLWAFNHNGSLCSEFPVPRLSWDTPPSSPILIDADGNGDLNIVAATQGGEVSAFSRRERVSGFPLSTGSETTLTPFAGDLDGDGLLELAAVSGRGSVFVWNLNADVSETASWAAWGKDAARTAFFAQPSEPAAPREDWMPSRGVYNYPNPVRDGRTFIRYRLEVDARVAIRIVDMAGMLVQRLEGPGRGQTENEVIWDVSRVDSGVYFCHVRAVSAKGEKQAVIKIAVIR